MKKPKNIIFIVADSLRYDSVYERGNKLFTYTNDNAIQFSGARSSGCWTLPATASLFTGQLPHEHGATSQTRSLRNGTTTLAQRLKRAGYSTCQVTANVATTQIFGLDQGFDRVVKIWDDLTPKYKTLFKLVLMLGKPRVRKILLSKDVIAHKFSEDLKVGNCWVQNTCRDIFDRSLQILKENETRGERTFLFINLMESHFPYHIAPTFKFHSETRLQQIQELSGLYHMLNQSFLKKDKRYITNNMLQVFKKRQCLSWDLLSGDLDRFIQTLHENKDNLVVFAADHGDNFGEQEWVYHFSNVTEAGNRVVLFWLGADHPRARVINHPVSSRFVNNSILDSCGLGHSRGSLFNESYHSLPIIESFWYNNQGKTLPKYKYNQICFYNEEMRYVLRNNKWMHAPVQQEFEQECTFAPFGKYYDPIEEMITDKKRKKYIQKIVSDFRSYSSTIPF